MRCASLLLLVVVAACGGRSDDRVPTDLGTDTGASEMATDDTGAADAAADTGPTDAGPPDMPADHPDLGEPCGAVYCGVGTYCCAAECNLCLDTARVCGSMPCLGVDAGGPRDMGMPRVDSGVRCGTVVCAPSEVCMSCPTPFGDVPRCIAVGGTCF